MKDSRILSAFPITASAPSKSPRFAQENRLRMIPFSLFSLGWRRSKSVQDGNAIRERGGKWRAFIFKPISGGHRSICPFFDMSERKCAETGDKTDRPTVMLGTHFPRGHSAKPDRYAAHVFGHMAEIFSRLPTI